MISLSRGQKIKLTDLSSALQLQVALRFDAPHLKFDFSCFGLDENGKLSDDRYFIFYNQKQSPEKALQLQIVSPFEARFALDLSRLPATVKRLVFVATIDGEGSMNAIRSGNLFLGAANGARAQFALKNSDFSAEKAVMVAEIYFKSEWRVAANGQGFRDGLSAVLKHFGGQEIVDAPNAPSHQKKSTPPPVPQSVPRPVVAPTGPNICTRCGQEIGFWKNLTVTGRAPRRCRKCDGDVKRVLGTFRQAFLHFTSNATLSAESWKTLRADLNRERVPWDEGLAFIRGDAIQLLERNLAMASANGIIEPHQEREFNSLQVALAIPPHLANVLNERLLFLKDITRIRQGHLPQVTTTTHLDSGEICHLEVGASFHKVGARAVTLVPGRLLVTNKKLHFLSQSGGWTMQYKNVMRIEGNINHIYLELATRQGNGRYDIAVAARAEAIIDAVTRLNKRQLMLPHEGRDTRSVPHHVQVAVWQRDGGKCVQCSANSYLEYDHIIPRSKGGATSETNIQLLCRRCNLAKGDRI